MTFEQAMSLCAITPSAHVTSTSYVDELNRVFPVFNWRVILDRSCDYSRWSLTVDDNDKREHFVPVGGTCIHCGRTAADLDVEEREVEER